MYFQINVTPKEKKLLKVFKDKPEPPAILVLGPFQPQTPLKLETNLYAEASTELIIKNSTNRVLHVNITKRPPDERCISFSYSEVFINPNSESTLTLLWKPNKIGSWRDTLQLTDNRRIKYDVALIFICNKVQKGKIKCTTRSRVLTQSNKIRQVNVESIKVLLPSKVAMNEQNMKQDLNVIEENKENYRDNINNDNLKTTSRQIYTVDSKIVTVNNLNISDFQLTSLNPCDNVKPVQILQVQNIDAPPKCSTTYDIEQSINILEMSDSTTKRKNDGDFMPAHESLSPKSIEKKSLLRRQTYLNSEPKFCKHMDSIDENFDDSLTPELFTIVRESTEERDFSMMLNNIVNLTTPIKNISPATCSTECKSDTITEGFSKDNLQSITANTIDVVMSTSEKSKSSNVCDANKSPKSTQNTGLIRPSKLTSIIAKMSSNALLSNIPKINSSLPLEPIVDHQQISIQSNDPSSAKAILEADLWAKDDNPQQASFLVTNQENINHTLDMITEETVTVTKKITIEASSKSSEKYVTTLRKSSKFSVEISPPKKIFSNTCHVKSTKKISPINHNKVMKDKSLAQHNSVLRKKVQASNISSKQRINSSIPGVQNTKLCLKNLGVTSVLKKSIPQDPFLNHRLYYDDEWILHQELEFTKWLNALLTPLEHNNADVETACVDVGKVWQLCHAKENVTLAAETKETVSARYHDTNARLYTLRKAACAMFMRDDVKNILAQVIACIEKGFFVIRQDRDLHRDIGLQKAILELLFSYNPLWLRIGLEVIYGEIIPLNSNNDLIGLTQFLITRFFSDPYLAQTYSHPYVLNLKLPEFQPHMNQFLLTKFFSIVYFLDYAKRNKLIAHDPCLFHKKAINKDSRDILLAFSREVLSGVGDITKILCTHGYVVSHKQTYLDEYNYAVKDISLDLRDGVRLCRLMELIIGDRTLTNQCRVPSISRLQKIHNVDLALNALIKAGYQITSDINAKSIVDGHRKKTLSLLWQIIYKFQRPRFEKSAIIIQKWWRAMLMQDRNKFMQMKAATIRIQKWFRQIRICQPYMMDFQNKRQAVIIIQRRLRATIAMRRERMAFNNIKHSTIIIKRWWRNVIITKRINNNYILQKNAADVIKSWWTHGKLMKIERERFLKIQNSTIIIQRCWKRHRDTKNYISSFQSYRKATIIIQTWWRNLQRTRECQEKYLSYRRTVILIQTRWREKIFSRSTRQEYLKLKTVTIKIQSYWRMILVRRVYLNKLKQHKAAIVLQRRWRAKKIGHEIHENYKEQKAAAILIQRKYRATKLAQSTRTQFLTTRNAAIIIQKNWRMYKATVDYHNLKTATIIIQTQWRAQKLTITTRKSFVTLRNSAITIQRFYRAYCIGKIIRNEYIQYRFAIIRIQSTWRMIQARREYHSKIHATIIIQRTWRRFIIARNTRNKFLAIRASALIIQKRYRLNKMCKEIRQNNYNELRISKVIWIQRRWRMIQLRKKLSIEYKDKLKRNNAATIIQAMWQGYKVRTSQSLEIQELRKRSKKAAKAATPSTTVEYRLKAAMNLLLNFTNIGQLTMCLACIDTLTRLSPKGCILFCELQLVERLYAILEKSNRSLPWMDVCKRCANILITLAKLPDTAKHVRNINEMEIIARLMNTAIKYDVDLFLHLATLFWLLLNDPEFLLEVKNCERTIWLLKTLIVSVMKKENALMKLKNNKNISAASQSMLLPNTKPDWGLKARRPRCFTTIQQAITIFIDKLDISTS